MNLRPDCGGCQRDSNDPALHAPHCNYSQFPGLYDTIEAQKRRIESLDAECRSANKRVCDADERQRQRDHHEVLRDVLKELVRGWCRHHDYAPGFDEPGVVDCVRNALLFADLAYPAPNQEAWARQELAIIEPPEPGE